MASDVTEKIIDMVDIVDLISEVVDLRRRGANFVGLCPFHQEKTPSFTVSPEKRIFKCFGCGKSGNIFSFMMEYYGMTFGMALRELAKRAGIKLEMRDDRNLQQEVTRNDQILLALESAKFFYQKVLFTQSGVVALSYLKNRGFLAKTIEEFGIGYAPSGWDNLFRELISKGIPTEIMVDAGLIKSKENKPEEFYDMFRERIIFPIQNHIGKVVGFGGRILKELDDQPKYINSPQTAVFDKSKLLFGLFLGRNEIRNQKSVILVEGYADVVALHQAGFKNAVASCGTSLTTEQLEQIARYANTIYLAYDSDEAGAKATERAIQMALPLGFEVLVVRLLKGEDPDSFVQKYGAKAFHSLLDNSQSFVRYLVESAKDKDLLSRPAQKSLVIRHILSIINTIPDALQHDDFVRELADVIGLPYSRISSIYNEKAKLTQKRKTEPIESASKNTHYREKTDSSLETIKELLPEERNLLEVCLTEKGAIDCLTKDYHFDSSQMMTKIGKDLLETILQHKHKNIINSIMLDENVAESVKKILVDISFSQAEPSPNWERFAIGIEDKNIGKIVKEVYSRLKIRKLEQQMHETKALLSQGSENADELLQKYQELLREKQKIKSSIK